MTAPIGTVLRTDTTPAGTVSLIEIEYVDPAGRTWAVVATDLDGRMVSDLDDALLVTPDEAVVAYTRLLDHLHWLTAPQGHKVRDDG